MPFSDDLWHVLPHTQVQEQHRNGKRIKLNIVVEAPEVVVPVQSDSYHTLVVDLGKISVSNSFCLVQVEGGDELTKKSAIAEAMEVKLSNMQVSR